MNAIGDSKTVGDWLDVRSLRSKLSLSPLSALAIILAGLRLDFATPQHRF
jgi:hypothetical protein